MKTKMRIVACCLLLTLWNGVTAQQKKSLTNQDVIAMLTAGLDEQTVLMAIQANPDDFDLSVPGLIALKNANVSGAIMRAMVDKAGKRSGNTATAAPIRADAPPKSTAPAWKGPAVFRPFPIDFSAESFATIGGKPAVSEGKVNVGSGRLRFESTAEASTTIVDPLKPVAYVSLPGKAAEMKTVQGVRGSPAMMPGVSMFFLPADPQNPCQNWDAVACTATGTDTVDGRATTKWVLTHRFEDTTWHSTIWVDLRLHFVSKRQYKQNVFELRNISEGPQSASLFEVK
jgi:hypothetical protein